MSTAESGRLHPVPVGVPPRRFWLAWPPADEGHANQEARDDCIALAGLLSEFAPVTMLANPEEVAECSLRTPPGVTTLAAVHDGRPLRGLGPVFLCDEGGHPAGGLDMGSPVARAVLDAAGLPTLPAPAGFDRTLVDLDGEGTCLALVRLADRLGGTAKAEEMLAEHLGVERTIWIENAAGDGGVAAEAGFLAPGVVAVGVNRDPKAEGFVIRQRNLEVLKGASDARGRRIKVVELPRPKRRAGSYTDALVADGLIVVPAFEDARDREAESIVASALAGKKVMSFPATRIAPAGEGLGAAVIVEPRVS